MKNSYSDILVSYTKRLITTSSRSRTIFFGKDNNFVMDFFSCVKKADHAKLLSFLNGDEDKFVINAPKSNFSKAHELFEKYNARKVQEDAILELFPSFTNNDFETLKQENLTEQTCMKLFNKYEKASKNFFKQLTKINDNNQLIKKESGKDDLYIGYPYIEGQFNGDKIIRAPLVLHKVNMEENGNKIILTYDNTKILNPVFVMSYLIENNKKYRDHLDFEILEDNYLDIAKLILSKIGIETKWNFNTKTLSPITPYTKKEFKAANSFEDNIFDTKNYIAIGVFPLSNKKIYDDVKELSMDENLNSMLNNFYDSSSEYTVFEEDQQDINESQLKYITTLDYSQKKTLSQAINENHIIQGPPGTGKSQVIANIVANLVLNQKKILVCSEKRTATDVIYNRLGNLSSFALLLHDQVSEKEYFYQSINIYDIIIKGTQNACVP